MSDRKLNFNTSQLKKTTAFVEKSKLKIFWGGLFTIKNVF